MPLALDGFLCPMRLAHTNAGTFCDLMQKTYSSCMLKQGGVVQVTPKRHLVFSLPSAVPFPYQTRKADFHHGSSAFAARTPRCLRCNAVRSLYAAVFQGRQCPMCRFCGTTESVHPYRPIREDQNSACRSELSRERHQKSEEGIGGGAPNLH